MTAGTYLVRRLALAAVLGSLSACAAAPSGLFVRHNPNAVTPVSDTELIQVGRAVDRLESDPDLRLVLIGHADATGDATANKELSFKRARYLRDLLFEQGIPKSSVTVAARGEEAPAASNETPEGRALNRRTEFFFFFPSSISLDENYGVRLVIDRE